MSKLSKQTTIIKSTEINGRTIEVYGSPSEPLFLAKDVAEWIEHSDPSRMAGTIDDNEKLVRTMFVSGQNREVLMITEDGLYEILMQSRKPIAKEFKKAVKQMLKEMRQYGFTATEDRLDELVNNPDLIIKLGEKIKLERDRRRLAEIQHALAEEVIKEQAPKVDYHDQVLISERTYTTTTIAKELGTGAPSLHRELNRRGVMYKADGHWVLYHRHQGKGYTKTRTATYTDRYGNQQSTITTVWTEKGREWLHRIFNTELKKA